MKIFNVRDAGMMMKKLFGKLENQKTLKLATALVSAAMILSACNGGAAETKAAEPLTATAPVTATPVFTPTAEWTPTVTVTPTITPSPTPEFPTYSECGVIVSNLPSEKDIYGHDRPTAFVETRRFGPTTEALVLGCLNDTQGKVTDPNDIVNGLETTVTFYDKYGKPHTYRLITGGERLNNKNFTGKDKIFCAELFTYGVPGYTRSGFQKLLSEYFTKNQSNEVLMFLYVKGGNGDSPFYDRVSQNAEIYEQIVEAIKTGEGFPDNLPEDFFLYVSTFRGRLVD